ncbi:MAG: undecaprenyl-diphosphate phosphatase [archaeon]
MEIIDAIILGIIQGITEWLPISSSGHLVIFQELFSVQVPVFYDIMLHLATLIVILIVFNQEIINILKSCIRWKKDRHFYLGLYILIGSFFTAVIGLLFKDLILPMFTSLLAVSIALIVTGILLLLTKFVKLKREIKVKDSIIIGLVQGLALIPGISRSGSTISTGLLLGIKREEIATFSFLLFIPAVIGATILEYDSSFIVSDLIPVIIGMLITIIVGYVTLKFLLEIIKKQKFWVFSIYCFILATFLLIYLYLLPL